MSDYPISVKPFGENAALVEWPNEVSEHILDDILQFSYSLKNEFLDASEWELVPAYNSLTLIHRKDALDFAGLKKNLKSWYSKKGKKVFIEQFLWRLPVCYHLDFGIDLQDVSDGLGKSIAEIVLLHTQQTYTVYGIGFLPGFMYLGGLPASLETPRRKTPRLKVEKGSVGLAGKQTGIYPQESPGGWNIIGKCPIPIFDVTKEEPCFVNVGDKIQFYSISKAEYELHKIEAEVGIYKIEKADWNAQG